jgi:hypothetical protein
MLEFAGRNPVPLPLFFWLTFELIRMHTDGARVHVQCGEIFE